MDKYWKICSQPRNVNKTAVVKRNLKRNRGDDISACSSHEMSIYLCQGARTNGKLTQTPSITVTLVFISGSLARAYVVLLIFIKKLGLQFPLIYLYSGLLGYWGLPSAIRLHYCMNQDCRTSSSIDL